MKEEELFGKELLKKIKKANKSKAAYIKDNIAMKTEFKKNFNKQVFGIISEVMNEQGYDNDVEEIQEFYSKVNSGNFDNTDVELFKTLVEPHMNQIRDRLRECGNFDGDKMPNS